MVCILQQLHAAACRRAGASKSLLCMQAELCRVTLSMAAVCTGICKIVPPVAPVLPGGMVLSSVEGKGFRFTTRQQTLAEPNWSNFESINPFSDGTK